MEYMYNEDHYKGVSPIQDFGYGEPGLGFDGEFEPEYSFDFDERLVATINNCEAVCLNMHTMILRRQDIQRRLKQLDLLRDCADVCGTTVKFIASGSRFARNMAAQCAEICERCGNECARFPDRESRRCARICLHCARECRRFAQY
ncbi:four-helix bundle copper-binding protein [Haloplasma contractile]|uniref:Ferredoxin protein n=1 Tax=Haloplasma contractile SSD-17B TaxID=1033810 RepID=U2EAB5_9MOLU|nr:four-helix bundle copper-binding protein [Haloplasma contractile]ERJ12033.1 ferredoxin protein [Haloplasma contractile SSD-17B]